MARVVINDKRFKVICMSVSEAKVIGFGIDSFEKRVIVCDKCCEPITGNVYYVAALNQCLCTSCYFKWYEHSKRYNEDKSYETKNFEETLNALKTNNILVIDDRKAINTFKACNDVLHDYKIIAAIRRINYGNIYHYCGYVGVVQEYADLLPLAYISTVSMEHDEAMLDDFVDVHGGITFSGKFTDTTPIIPVTKIPPYYHKYHWYGFDLNHHGDAVNGISTNFEYCKKEVLSLMKQINKLIVEKLLKTNCYD